jgi:hypothetical protein
MDRYLKNIYKFKKKEANKQQQQNKTIRSFLTFSVTHTLISIFELAR